MGIAMVGLIGELCCSCLIMLPNSYTQAKHPLHSNYVKNRGSPIKILLVSFIISLEKKLAQHDFFGMHK